MRENNDNTPWCHQYAPFPHSPLEGRSTFTVCNKFVYPGRTEHVTLALAT
jgi:hypothetical protein